MRKVFSDSLIASFVIFLCVLPMFLTNLQPFSIGNDYFFNLGTGMPFNAETLEFPVQFAEEAKNRCIETDAHCINYKNVLSSDLPFNYPIMSLMGLLIEPVDDFINHVQKIGIAAGWIGLLASLLIIFIVGITSNIPIRIFCFLWIVAALRFCLNFKSIPSNPLIYLPLQKVALLGAISFTLANSKFLREYCCKFLLTFYGMVFFFISLVGLFTFTPYGTGSFLILCFFVFWATALKESGDLNWLGLLVGLVAVVAAHSDIFWLGLLPIPRGNLLLLLSVMLPVILLKPKSRICWLIFLLLFFHVSVTCLLAFLIFLTELIVFLFKKRTSQLLFASFFLLIISFGIAHFQSGFSSIDIELFFNSISKFVLSHKTESLKLVLSSLTQGLLLFFFGIALLTFPKNGRWDAVSKVTLMMALLQTLSLLSNLLKIAGVETLTPGLASIILAPDYLSPQLHTVVLITVCAELFVKRKEFQPIKFPTSFRINISIIAVSFLVWGFGESPYSSDISSVMSERVKALKANSNLYELSGADEIYLITDTRQANDPLEYLSMLKYRVRLRNGLIDRSKSKIEVVPAP